MIKKPAKIKIFGVDHAYDSRGRDVSKNGKKSIFDFLNKFYPDIIFIEQGYGDQLIDEFDGRPANNIEKEKVQNNHWATIWACDKKTEVRLTDLEKNVKRGTKKEIIRSMREGAIFDSIMSSVQDGHKKISLFCGKDHAEPIKKKLQKYFDVDIKNLVIK